MLRDVLCVGGSHDISASTCVRSGMYKLLDVGLINNCSPTCNFLSAHVISQHDIGPVNFVPKTPNSLAKIQVTLSLDTN